MFFPDSQVRVWLYCQPCDMRKSFTGLCALVKRQLQEDPLSGHLFTFINRKQTYMKVLYFNRGGYCIWSKKLTQGQFNYRKQSGIKQALDIAQLTLLIEGIDTTNARRYKRYQRAQHASIGYNTAP